MGCSGRTLALHERLKVCEHCNLNTCTKSSSSCNTNLSVVKIEVWYHMHTDTCVCTWVRAMCPTVEIGIAKRIYHRSYLMLVHAACQDVASSRDLTGLMSQLPLMKEL